MENQKSYIMESLQKEKCKISFIRLSTKKEQISKTSKMRGFEKIAEKEGQEIVHMQHGKYGAGYYYSQIIN